MTFPAVDELGFIDEADAKAGQVRLVLSVKAGEFGRFTAEQGASRLPTSSDDPLHVASPAVLDAAGGRSIECL
jgi:hypothetical protein